MAVELCYRLQRGAVVRIHKRKVFDKQQVHDVGPVALEHRNARVTALHDLAHGVEIEHGVAGDHEAIAQRGHDNFHGLSPQLQRALDDVQLLFYQVIIRIRDPQHLQELFSVVHRANLLAEEIVEQFTYRIGRGESE